MSTRFLLELVAVVVVLLAARLLRRELPVRGFAARLSTGDGVALIVGTLGLVFHCGAMFFRSRVEAIPGTGAAVRAVDALGGLSVVWYVVAALLVLLGLRRLPRLAVALLALALLAVGVTMYDGGPLHVHLTAIFVAVLLLAAVVFLLALPPWHTHKEPVTAA